MVGLAYFGFCVIIFFAFALIDEVAAHLLDWWGVEPSINNSFRICVYVAALSWCITRIYLG